MFILKNLLKLMLFIEPKEKNSSLVKKEYCEPNQK